jgi:hypothetical protein
MLHGVGRYCVNGLSQQQSYGFVDLSGEGRGVEGNVYELLASAISVSIKYADFRK